MDTDRLGRLAEELAGAKANLAETRAAVSRLRGELSEVRSRLADMTQQSANLDAEVEAMRNTLSWRITLPLRAIRRRPRKTVSLLQPGHASAGHAAADDEQNEITVMDEAAARVAFATRLGQATSLLGGSTKETADVLASLEQAIAGSSEAATKVAWLAYVAATGRYPDEVALNSVVRRIDGSHPGALRDHLTDLFEQSLDAGVASLAHLDVVLGGNLIDVTHTASHDLHTGIQRVVREVGVRWLALPGSIGVWWDTSRAGMRRLGTEELNRFLSWRSHVSKEDAGDAPKRALLNCPDDIVVPWGSTLVLPELVGEPARVSGYRALATAEVLARLSMVGYDLIPLTAAETVADGMSGYFSLYLSLVKLASRVSTISETTASDFRSFASTLPSQGLVGPTVQAHLLPASPHESTAADIETTRDRYSLGASPLVLVVGSHEPRKNHSVVLAAAEQLWSEGNDFKLVFIGGSGWKGAQFDREVDRLQMLRSSLITRKRAGEAELWAAYRLARFTIFPSLLEGFGLPIVESMSCGTPVITSNYGAMAEVAAGGGALMIEPRSVGELVSAMRRLLEDDELLAELKGQAALRQWPSWFDYSARVWTFLTSTDSGDC